MIGIRLHGRLGNQLFQYAFAYATAKKLATRFYLDKRFECELLTQYFEIDSDTFSWLDNIIFSIKGFRGFFSQYLKIGFYSQISKRLTPSILEIDGNEKPEIELRKLANKTYYIGYFQSEACFLEYRSEIKSRLSIKEKYIKQFKNIAANIIDKRYVVVHVRRTDYLNSDFELPLSYFHKAIEQIKSDKNFYVIISDDPDFVESEFNYLTKKYISREKDIIDFQFIINADVCILSNSSFSWWCAYLNDRKAKIIAPEYWFGFQIKKENPNGIIVDQWITIAP